MMKSSVSVRIQRSLVAGLVLAISMVGISYGAGGVLPGDGLSESTAYLIEDLDDFDVFADSKNSATYWANGVYTKLMCNIDLSVKPAYTTAVIALDTDSSNYYFDGTPFEGIFDGNGYVIIDLTIDTADANNDWLGLFGQISGSGAQVKNLGVKDVNITSGIDSCRLGGLCGYNDGSTITNCHTIGAITGGTGSFDLGGLCGYNDGGTITNCYVTGSVAGADYLGGLCGCSYGGTITNCYATSSVISISTDYYECIGGLCGENNSTINNCYAAGPVTGGMNSYDIGGLCGYNFGTIDNCYATGAVTGGDDSYDIGGLCGYNYGTITNSYATGSVTCEEGSCGIGGLCGRNQNSTITNSYATGEVTGEDYSYDIGGLCGYNYCGNSHYSTIDNCYATGAVAGGKESYNLGGLCGNNDNATIDNCYSIGAITAGVDPNNLGGLCGFSSGPDLITDSFWDVQTSGIGSEGDNNYGATGKVTEQMHMKSTFTNANWDFSVVPDWHMPFQATGYPMLGWQKDIPGDFIGRYGVDMVDFAVLSNAWLSDDSPTANWNQDCDLAGSGIGNSVIDMDDLEIFVENWLCGTQ